jgi:hypothetical protein
VVRPGPPAGSLNAGGPTVSRAGLPSPAGPAEAPAGWADPAEAAGQPARAQLGKARRASTSSQVALARTHAGTVISGRHGDHPAPAPPRRPLPHRQSAWGLGRAGGRARPRWQRTGAGVSDMIGARTHSKGIVIRCRGRDSPTGAPARYSDQRTSWAGTRRTCRAVARVGTPSPPGLLQARPGRGPGLNPPWRCRGLSSENEKKTMGHKILCVTANDVSKDAASAAGSLVPALVLASSSTPPSRLSSRQCLLRPAELSRRCLCASLPCTLLLSVCIKYTRRDQPDALRRVLANVTRLTPAMGRRC